MPFVCIFKTTRSGRNDFPFSKKAVNKQDNGGVEKLKGNDMTESKHSMDKRFDKEPTALDSAADSIRRLEEQINDAEKVLRESEEKSLNLIDILQRSRSDFFAIFDSVPAVIWYRDRDGNILRANQCAADSVGIGVRDLVGKNYYELVPADAERCHHLDVEVIVSGRPMQGVQREYEMADGMARWMMEDRFPLRDKSGRVIGVMVFAQDITDRKQAEERLIAAKREIEIRNKQLKVAADQSRKLAEDASRSNLAKSEILASSSHDLRTPMNAIIGFAELLLDSQLSEEQTEYVQTIYKSATSLLSVINDILDFTKLEVGKLNVQIVACNLTAFVNDIRSMMEPGILQKGLTFDIRTGPRLPETFYTDPFRLRQCLVNLIGNAMKFTDTGGISLCVKSEHRAARSCILFDVEDTGIGISEAMQHQIFQSYAQAEDAIERIYGGTGLGLTITRKLVDLLGGHISVMSKLGKGSAFSIILPLVDAPSSQIFNTMTESALLEPGESRTICRGRILVADTNSPSQLTMNLLLRRVGLQVEMASTVEQIYEQARIQEFDVIVLNFTPDTEQDIAVIEKLHSLNADVPIVAIAPCDLELMKKCLAAGCSKYLSKPVSRRQLYETVFELTQQTAFEKQLKSMVPRRDDPENQTFQGRSESQESFDGTEAAFEPRELVKLLLSLIEELPAAFEPSAMAQIAEVIDVLGKVSVFCGNPAYRQKVNEIEAYFRSNLDNEQQNTRMLAQLEQICRDVYECCERKIV